MGMGIGEVRATDIDGLGQIQYTTGAGAEQFAVFPTDGTIQLRSSNVMLDFESMT